MTVNFKSKRSFYRAFLLHPICIMILGDMALWAMLRKLPFVVTETGTTEDEDKAVNRKHKVHRDFRGFDLRSFGWPKKDQELFKSYFDQKYARYAATSASTGEKNLVVIHVGTAPHFHIQIEAIYALDGINLDGSIYETE